MKKLIVLFMLIIVMCGDLFAQTTPPSAYTTYYKLRMWSQGARASADSLNQNWKDIDAILYNLIVNVDPRYFAWKDVNHDTLTLNNLLFGTLSFGDGENFYLPYHDPPFTNLAVGALGYTTGGWLTMRISSRVDSMLSLYQYRAYRSGTESIAGNKTYNGTSTFNNTSTWNTVPTLYYYKTLWNWQWSAFDSTLSPEWKDSTYIRLNAVAGITQNGDLASGYFIKDASMVSLKTIMQVTMETLQGDFDYVYWELIATDGTTSDTTRTIFAGETQTAELSLSVFTNGFPIYWRIYYNHRLTAGKPDPNDILIKAPYLGIKCKLENQ